jgi:hypothetical protein
MLGSAALDASIGLILVYLVLSLVCSAFNELLEGFLKHRAADLEKGIRVLLSDPNGTGLAKQLYEHPLVAGLFPGAYKAGVAENLPSYIPSRNFALALLDVLMPAGTATPSGAAGTLAAAAAPAPHALASVRAAVAAMTAAPQVQRALLTLIDAAGDDITQARMNIEQWFNGGMDRVSGWYKRRKQKIILAIGLLVAIVVNVSSITVAKTLWSNQTLRESLAAVAQDYIEAQNKIQPGEDPRHRLDRNVQQLESFGLPIGWTWEQDDPRSIKQLDPGIWLERVLGWLLTACAISFGAPFWFDLLNKFTVIRSTVKPHEKSPEETSKD